jgi:hypothetical protein
MWSCKRAGRKLLFGKSQDLGGERGSFAELPASENNDLQTVG